MFSRKVQNQTDKIEAYLELIPLPKLTKEQSLSCEGIISEDKALKSLKYIENNKSPGNDGLSNVLQIYEFFFNFDGKISKQKRIMKVPRIKK